MKTRIATAVIAANMLLAGHSIAAEKNENLEEVIVTGVFGAKSLEEAAVSISVISEDELAQQIPNSAADILKNVPGVFVNSALGEIRNIVFSRGVSANSLDGDGGYFYVSMQEDGVPVELVTASNYGPDYFTRPDIMLDHVEALRGGTASVTGANAPGGIFNYISRTGKSHDLNEVHLKYGSEGDNNPYKRVDLYTGGELKENIYYAIGGFYRESDGARNPGYDLNNGGQVRANLLFDYDKGSVKISAKYLDDKNAWFEFTPAVNYADPKIAPGFDENSSVLPPADGAHDFYFTDGSKGRWDPSNKVHSKATGVNLEWKHEMENGWNLNANLGYSKKSADWNTGAVISIVPLTDFMTAALTGGIHPGTTVYKIDGQTVAAIDSTIDFTGQRMGPPFPIYRALTTNNLPNQNLLEGGILTQAALTAYRDATNVFGKMVFTKSFEDHDFAFGIELANANNKNKSGGAGFGLSTLEHQPRMLDISVIDQFSGQEFLVTDSSGFGAMGSGLFDGTGHDGDQKQMSIFIGDTWRVSDKMTVDLAARYEEIDYDITNYVVVGTEDVNDGGGYDNNPLTLWDNAKNVIGSNSVSRDFDYTAVTGAVTYEFSDELLSYIRLTSSKKAPDFGIIASLNTPDQIEGLFPEPQKVEQIEIGIKFKGDNYNLSMFPFYSKLSNVADGQIAVDDNNVLYSPPSVFGTIKTKGIEFEGDLYVTENFELRGSLTLQKAEASGFSSWALGEPTRDDDVLVTTPAGDADNNPKIMFRSTATWRPTENVSTYLTYSYIGSRPANRLNSWDMPGFGTADLGAMFNFNESTSLHASVTNITNEVGVMSWARAGGFFESLDRQGLTPEAVASTNANSMLAFVPNQPRAYWLTLKHQF